MSGREFAADCVVGPPIRDYNLGADLVLNTCAIFQAVVRSGSSTTPRGNLLASLEVLLDIALLQVAVIAAREFAMVSAVKIVSGRGSTRPRMIPTVWPSPPGTNGSAYGVPNRVHGTASSHRCRMSAGSCRFSLPLKVCCGTLPLCWCCEGNGNGESQDKPEWGRGAGMSCVVFGG